MGSGGRAPLGNFGVLLFSSFLVCCMWGRVWMWLFFNWVVAEIKNRKHKYKLVVSMLFLWFLGHITYVTVDGLSQNNKID